MAAFCHMGDSTSVGRLLCSLMCTPSCRSGALADAFDLNHVRVRRDHRDEIYRPLMELSVARNDNAAASKFGDRWLSELDAIKPDSNEERSALDIACVEMYKSSATQSVSCPH
jgi:hypothetical protein